MRIRINGLEMGPLKPGECRQISSEELKILKKELNIGETS
jgi:16S rRNA U516 pseudouridylate synthase RsuA-like enzyme